MTRSSLKKTEKSYEETGCHVLLRFTDSDYPLGIFKFSCTRIGLSLEV